MLCIIPSVISIDTIFNSPGSTDINLEFTQSKIKSITFLISGKNISGIFPDNITLDISKDGIVDWEFKPYNSYEPILINKIVSAFSSYPQPDTIYLVDTQANTDFVNMPSFGYIENNIYEETPQQSIGILGLTSSAYTEEQILMLSNSTYTVHAFVPYVNSPFASFGLYIAKGGSTFFCNTNHENSFDSSCDMNYQAALREEHLARRAESYGFNYTETFNSTDLVARLNKALLGCTLPCSIPTQIISTKGIVSLNYTVVYDDAPVEEMTINQPLGIIYNSTKVMLNISLSQEAFTLLYTDKWTSSSGSSTKNVALCRNCSSSGKDKKKYITLGEGHHSLTFTAKMPSGNTITKEVNLVVDSKKPVISSMLPGDGKLCNGTFKVKYNEENLLNMRLYYANNFSQRYDCTPSKNGYCIFNVDLTNLNGRQIRYFFDATDYFSTFNYKQNFTCTVDSQAPEFLLAKITPNSKYAFFNVTLSEKLFRLILEENGKQIRLCSNCDSYGYSSVRKRVYSPGQHNISLIAIDYAGNNHIEAKSFIIG
jgi:hypothetical protein